MQNIIAKGRGYTHHRGTKMSIMNRKDEISKQWLKISPPPEQSKVSNHCISL
jgi:hypothetical protein